MNHAEIGATAYPTSVIPRRAKPDVGIRSPLRRSWYSACPKGMRIATASVSTGFAMTGGFLSYAPFLAMQKSLAPQGAAPSMGSPQCAHWGKGSPGWVAVQEGKDRTQCRQFFSPLAVPQPWRPLNLAIARQLLLKGRQGLYLTLIQPIFFRFLKTRKYFLFFALIYAKIVRIM